MSILLRGLHGRRFDCLHVELDVDAVADEHPPASSTWFHFRANVLSVDGRCRDEADALVSTFLRNEICSNNLTGFGLRKGLAHLAAVREKFLEITDRFAAFPAQCLNVHGDFLCYSAINRPKSPRFPDSRPRTRVFDNSTHPAVLFLSTKKGVYFFLYSEIDDFASTYLPIEQEAIDMLIRAADHTVEDILDSR